MSKNASNPIWSVSLAGRHGVVPRAKSNITQTVKTGNGVEEAKEEKSKSLSLPQNVMKAGGVL